MTSKQIRTIVVDDEPLAREYLRALLDGQSDFRVVAEATDGRSAVAVLQSVEADVVFLDVQMPGINGLQVVETVGEPALPLIVFVTAFDEYAIKAFDMHAVDYLLKPFDDARFEKMIKRVRERLSARTAVAERTELLRSLSERLASGSTARITKIPLRQNNRVDIVAVEKIDWIEAADYCVTVHVGGKSYLLRESLSVLERQLDATMFVRTHRGALVNIRCIRELRSMGGGDYEIVLLDGTVVPLSRRRKKTLERALGRPL